MKNYIVGAVVGVCVAVTAFHVWFTWTLVEKTNANTAAVQEIVNFINGNIQK